MLLREEHGHSRLHLFRAQTRDFYHAQLYQVFVDVFCVVVNGQPDTADTGPCHKRMNLIRSGTRSLLHLIKVC